MRTFRRGEVWWTTIADEHAVGGEFSDGVRESHPFLILSENRTTAFGLCVGVPGTGKLPKETTPEKEWRYVVEPADVVAVAGDSPISLPTCFCCEQLRVVSTKRLKRRAGKMKGLPTVEISELVRKLLRLD